MKLEWMGTYRGFIEKLIKYGNSYAQAYKVENAYATDIAFSAAQLQVMEYILENENENQNMAEIAGRLGITPSAFSKNVKKMVDKGLLEKYHMSTNKKDVIIRVSPLGKEVYAQYVKFAYERAYKEIFAILDEIPEPYIQKFTEILEISANETQLNRLNEKEVTYIKIE